MSARAALLFDSECRLCAAAARFVARRDVQERFACRPLQSRAAQPFLIQQGLIASERDSLVLIEDGRAFQRSTAVLRVVRQLPWPWPLLYALILVPQPIRDAAYELIARGRRRVCPPNRGTLPG